MDSPIPTEPLTLFEKLWRRHVVDEGDAASTDGDTGQVLLYVDRHLVYEVTSPQAFEGLRLAGRTPWRRETVLATADHNVPTTSRAAGIADPLSRLQVEQLERNCDEFGIVSFGLDDPRQGIIHVIGPEQGATLPGMTVVAGDSHTSTHGAFAALADLDAQTVTRPDGERLPFSVDAERKRRLLLGQDDISLTLQRAGTIGAYEARRRLEQPWLFGPTDPRPRVRA